MWVPPLQSNGAVKQLDMFINLSHLSKRLPLYEHLSTNKAFFQLGFFLCGLVGNFCIFFFFFDFFLGKGPFFFFFFFSLSFVLFQGRTHGMWRFPGQGSNRSYSHSHSHSKARSELCLRPTPQLTAAMPDPEPTEQGQGLNPQPRGSQLDSFLLCHDGNSQARVLNERPHGQGSGHL